MAQCSLTCDVCGRSFFAGRIDAKYCSSKCRSQIRYIRNRDYYKSYWESKYNKSVEKICIHCGKKFHTSRTLQKYCSVSCRKMAWKKTHREVGCFHSRNHSHRKRATSDGSVTFEAWEKMKKACDYTCLICGVSEPEISLTIDHIKPISKGGTHTIDNIQPLCVVCNSRKNNFYEEASE